VDNRFPKEIKDTKTKPLFLVSDKGCQPTSIAYMRACASLRIKQISTSWSNPKGNADTERVIRTLKENLIWPYDRENPLIFKEH